MPAPNNTAIPLDGIEATVNNEIIMQSEVNQAMAITTARLKASHIPVPPKANLRRNVLNQLINRKLQLQLAKRNGMRVSSSQVKAYFKALAKSQNLSVNELLKKFAQQGLSGNTLDKTIKEQILISAIQHQALIKLIKPSAAEIAAIKNKIQDNKNNHTFYNVNDILISQPNNATTQQILTLKKRAQDIIKQLRSGKTVNQIQGIEVNVLGWKNANQLPTLFINALKGKRTGNYIGPIQAGNGFHILQLNGSRSDHSAGPNTAQIQQIAMQQKYVPAMMKWLKQLRKTSYIKIFPSP